MSDVEITLARLTHRQVVMLGFVARHPDCSGADVARAYGWRTPNVYVMLPRIEKLGLVTSRWEDVDARKVGRPVRHLYRITDLGHRVLSRAAHQICFDTSEPSTVSTVSKYQTWAEERIAEIRESENLTGDDLAVRVNTRT